MELKEMLRELDGRRAALGEARPLDPEQVKRAQYFFRLDAVWSSNAVEDNTITRDEADIIIGDGMTVGNHTLRELFETLGGASAYDFMYTLKNGKPIQETDILKMHRLFAWNMPDIHPGRYRDCDVSTTRMDLSEHVYPSKDRVPELMNDLMKWYDANRAKLHPAILAADLHAIFVAIHPFRDGNGRVGRLLANTVLIQNGFLPMGVPKVRKTEYNLKVAAFGRQKTPFRSFIAEMALMTMQDYMRYLHIPYSPSKGLEK